MRKILYIQVGVGFLHLNKSVIQQLQKHYPDHQVELFDVLPLFRKKTGLVLVNLLYVLKEYFFDFLTFRKSIFKLKYHFLGTTFIFRHFSRLVREKLRDSEYDFVVQSQCLCDASGNGCPVYIYTDHTNLNNLTYRYIKHQKFMRTPAFIEMERRAFEKAELIMVMSLNIKHSLIEQYRIPESKVKLVYVGINTPHPTHIDRNKYQNKNIIFVGKEWERKGGPLLVKAFEKVLQRIPDATLTIIGCRPRVELRNCSVLGELPLKQVAAYYNQASVFCLPTVREPFGVVFIEAMFNRLPIVTNNMGAAPYLVTKANGFLLENDAEEYSNALVTLLENPGLCEEYGEESLRIAEESYTWDNVGRLMARYIGRSGTEEKVKADNLTETTR